MYLNNIYIYYIYANSYICTLWKLEFKKERLAKCLHHKKSWHSQEFLDLTYLTVESKEVDRHYGNFQAPQPCGFIVCVAHRIHFFLLKLPQCLLDSRVFFRGLVGNSSKTRKTRILWFHLMRSLWFQHPWKGGGG